MDSSEFFLTGFFLGLLDGVVVTVIFEFLTSFIGHMWRKWKKC